MPLTHTTRPYNHPTDFETVGRFLVRTYRAAGDHINWLQPRWEYMHYHPLIRNIDLGTIGIWEVEGEIVGVVHPEHERGTAYFEIDPRYDALRSEMLHYVEEHLSLVQGGTRRLSIYINESDTAFQALAAQRGFVRTTVVDPMAQFVPPRPYPPVSLPPGFRLRSLANENDLREVHRVLWRGFGHGDEPPDDGTQDRRFMQSAPNYRRALNVVVVAPDGHYVSYCGMWYEPVHRIAYVEPVATDPDYRRLGLGRAAVLEGIRRCGALGATVAYVGSTQPFYLSLGFELAYRSWVWQREER